MLTHSYTHADGMFVLYNIHRLQGKLRKELGKLRRKQGITPPNPQLILPVCEFTLFAFQLTSP